MSLDIYLHGPVRTVECTCDSCENVHTRDAADQLFFLNITHNHIELAVEADLYRWVWRPEEAGAFLAGQLLEPLRTGIALVRSDPKRFKQWDARNAGWGTYDNFVYAMERYLAACEANPEATVRVTR